MMETAFKSVYGLYLDEKINGRDWSTLFAMFCKQAGAKEVLRWITEATDGEEETMSTNEHPSDRLCRGGLSFEDALELVEQEWAIERAVAGRDVDDAAFLRAMEQGHEQINAALRHAGRVYREEHERARLRTVQRLREDVHAAEAALDDETASWLAWLAASLEDGDYGRLAI